jgi:hypothetical protein
MEPTTKHVTIAAVTDPDTGEVTMFTKNEKGGPVVTGATAAEAKAKMPEALLLSHLINIFWGNDPESGLTPTPIHCPVV